MKKFNDKKIKKGMSMIIEGLGLDLNDRNLKDTPERILGSYYEILGGLINTKKRITEALSKSFPTKYSGIVSIGPIKVYSLCPHHFLPIFYEIWVGYIPKKESLGLSKLPRVIEILSQRPVLQEDLTHDIIETIEKTIHPKGVAVYVKGYHLCMNMRGTKKHNVETTTSEMSGLFLINKDGCKDEFMRMIE